MAKKVPYLTTKDGRFYFRMRTPASLVPFLGAEVSKALGDVTRAQAAVMVLELAGEHAAMFLREMHRRGLVDNPPAPPPASARPRAATAEDVATISRAAARELLARDERIRIDGMRSEMGDWWRSTLADLDEALVAALSEGEMRGLWHDFIRDLKGHGLALPDDPTERRALAHRWATEQARALQGIKERDAGKPVETPPSVAVVKAHRMRDAFGAWKTAARRPEKTVGAFERHESFPNEV